MFERKVQPATSSKQVPTARLTEVPFVEVAAIPSIVLYEGSRHVAYELLPSEAKRAGDSRHGPALMLPTSRAESESTAPATSSAGHR